MRLKAQGKRGPGRLARAHIARAALVPFRRLAEVQTNLPVAVEVPVVGQADAVLKEMIKVVKAARQKPDKAALAAWWKRIDDWRRNQSDMPIRTEAIRRLVEKALSER